MRDGSATAARHHATPGRRWWAGIALVSVGCATASLPGTSVEPAPVIRMAERGNALERASHIEFEWSLEEPSIRTRGRGVARLEPPYRARLDLFTGSGETVATAALVGSEMRLPPGAPDMMPPPALFWASLGVFHPGEEATLIGSEREGEGDGEVHHLRYRLPGDVELRYLLREGRIGGAELVRNGRTVESVSLRQATGEFPGEATYRDLTAYRELKVTLESVEYVEGFPSRIWRPGL
jgi:hypothetical protein